MGYERTKTEVAKKYNVKVNTICDYAAKYNWGDEWTVPTKADFEELLENCEIQYKLVEIETTMYYNKKEEKIGQL